MLFDVGSSRDSVDWCIISFQAYTPPPAATPGGRGGFGTPKPKPADKRNKFKRTNINKPVESPAKSLSLGDFQNAVVRGNVEAVRKYLDEGKYFVLVAFVALQDYFVYFKPVK